MPTFDAIAIGTGPSFYKWVEAGDIPDVPLYGCGKVPWFLPKKLEVYAYGDGMHCADLPTDGTRIVATERVWKEGMELFGEIPHAGQSGGVAASMAAKEHKRVALIGFDSLGEPHDGFMRDLIKFWNERGRTFVSLMPPGTPWDDLMGRK